MRRDRKGSYRFDRTVAICVSFNTEPKLKEKARVPLGTDLVRRLPEQGMRYSKAEPVTKRLLARYKTASPFSEMCT
ncbi:uncharacterized protein ARMOST_06639 [Armillaria ostoyae]|uniref:Uncharacterized protein n=1 Tax=Armillaria ostoyae TaxID=47428 RepID=A0A284R3K6_ARMOS|nr:uncharacterized protein ARMOST_06639 [Armillaria ostoyae]